MLCIDNVSLGCPEVCSLPCWFTSKATPGQTFPCAGECIQVFPVTYVSDPVSCTVSFSALFLSPFSFLSIAIPGEKCPGQEPLGQQLWGAGRKGWAVLAWEHCLYQPHPGTPAPAPGGPGSAPVQKGLLKLRPSLCTVRWVSWKTILQEWFRGELQTARERLPLLCDRVLYISITYVLVLFLEATFIRCSLSFCLVA